MKDRNGVELTVGDRVYVLPSKKTERDGGAAYVRKIVESKARVDDGRANDSPDLTVNTSWRWSAWVTPEECEKI